MSVLSSQQSVDLQEAISRAFTSAELTRFADYRLELNLETIDGSNLSDKVYHLLKWAEARGKTSELIDAALRERPGNRFLVAAANNARAHLESGTSVTTSRLDRPVRPGRLPLPAIGRTVGSGPFVGRKADLARLRAAWSQVRANMPPLGVLLVGDAGVGKTRLAARFAEELHAAGATVLYGHSDEGEILPYQPFVEALRHCLAHGNWMTDPALAVELREVGRFVPEARRAADPLPDYSELPSDMERAKIDRSRLFEAAARLLVRVGREGPLLFIVDDLQWADLPTLQLLRHVLRHPETPPMMLLATFRDVEVGVEHQLKQILPDLRRNRRIVQLALGGLDERESGALVAAHLTLPVMPDFVRRLRAATGGNPLFMEETLRSLSDSPRLAAGESPSVILDDMGVPESINEVILKRLAGLSSDDVKLVLLAASAAGRDFDLSLLQALPDLRPGGVISALEEAVEAGLLREAPAMEHADRFSFPHDQVQKAIYSRMKKVRRMQRHAHIAEILEKRIVYGRALPGEVAHHYYLGAFDAGVKKVVRAASRAAVAAASSLAYEDAAAHYRRALEISSELGIEDEALCDVLQGLGRAAASALAHEDAAGHYRRALEIFAARGIEIEAVCDVLLGLGRAQWQAGDTEARESYLRAGQIARRLGDSERLALAALGMGERYWESNAVDQPYRELLDQALAEPPEDGVLHARLLARLAASLHFTNDHERADELSDKAVRMARRQADQKVLASVLMGRHVALLHVEHVEERLGLIDEVLRIGGHPKLVAEARQWRLYDLFERGDRGDITAANGELTELKKLTKGLRQPLFDHVADAWQGVWEMLNGHVGEAERLAYASYDLGRQAHAYDAKSVLTGKLFMLRRQQGRIGELMPDIEALAGGRAALDTWLAAHALALAETGELSAARAAFKLAADRGFDTYPENFFWSTTMALLAETCAMLGDKNAAAELLELLRPYAHRNVQVSFSCCLGSVERYVGLLCGVLGRELEAATHLLAAIERNGAMGAPLLVAEAQCDYGALLLARGRGEDRRTAHDLGAKALAEAIRDERKLDRLAARAAALQS